MWLRRIFRRAELIPRLRGRFRGQQPEVIPRLGAEAIRQMNRLQIRGSKALRGDRIGFRSSHRRTPAMEFREHRMYVPGDDLRFVDWRASARHESFFVRQGEMPKDVIVYLLVDCSGSMTWGRKQKRELQLALASSLGYMAFNAGDRVYVYPYGEQKNLEYGPSTGRAQLGQFIRYLNHLEYGGISDLEHAVRTLVRKVSRGGVVFILSDLLEKGDIANILSYLPAPKWWVNIIHLLHPAELDPEIRGAYELEDRETGKMKSYDLTVEALRKYRERMASWILRLELTAVESHAFYNLINTNWSLSKETLPYLREHQVLVSE